jgi:single-stranded-DNA-specific exonuclease
VVGEKHLKLKLVHRDSDTPLEAIAFRQAEKIEVQPGDPLQIAYRLDINEYRGNVTLQLVVEYMEHAGVVA